MIDSWEKIVDPNFINAELIGPAGSERVVTIRDIDFREAFDVRSKDKVMKQALIMDECRPLILNKTNRKSLVKMFGADDPAACVGKKVVLYVVDCMVGKQATTGIRIKEYSEITCEECGKPIRPAAGKQPSELVEISKRNT